MTNPIYAVGDIHGQTHQLDRALDLITADGGADAEIVFLGDLVDRGPDSRGVIDRVMQGQAAGKPWTVLKGNHDRMFARFVRGGVLHDPRTRTPLSWLHPRMGGITTLASYGLADANEMPMPAAFHAARAAVPQSHIDFIDQLPLYLERDGLLFVHAGILPGVPLPQQTEDDLVWIRDPFLNDPITHPWLVVHGHTALDYPQHFGNRIDLDGGVGFGRPLHPAVLEGRKCWLLTDDGRHPLTP